MMRWMLPELSASPAKGIRLFSSTAAAGREFAHVVNRKVKKPKELPLNGPDTLLPRQRPEYPPYPYGESHLYKQSNRGLYGGKYLQFGNKVSEKFDQKSGRIFYPNVQKTTLWSDALKQKLQIRLVTSVLRTITKEGGLDNYLIKNTPSRIKELGPFGWELRYDVLKSLEEAERVQPRPIDGLTVGKARLIKDLFTAVAATDAQVPTFKEFRLRHRDLGGDELLKLLQAKGVNVEQYKATA